ncbi:MAG: tetratricopeptide repeat protein, partial [Planctomycetes bacterium]|nr:tetratricopeptide repeat protein [Planctomycetota bacterium]
MAKKRVNKNMVAFLTVMGIALSVAVVAVATYQSVSKDPEVYASAARDLEQRGESERAIERYFKAYRVNNETKYLLDAARCAYRVGRIGGNGAIGMLIQAHTQSPNEPEVLEQLLQYYWDFRKSAPVWPDIRKYSERLLEINADHVEALVYSSTALANIEDDGNADLSAEVLARAIELAPNNPLVALARVEQEIAAAGNAAEEASERGLKPLDVPEVRARLDAALDILQIAIKEHPDDSPLVIRAVGLYGMLQREDEAEDALRAGIARMPDDADLHLALGRSLTAIIQKRRGESDAAEVIKTLAEEARKHLRRAVEFEPALYSAHMSLARLSWGDLDPTAEGQADLMRRGDAALKLLEDALAASVGLKSPRASLNWRAHMALYLEAFELALEYSVRLEDPQRKSEMMDRARAIHEQSVTAYPQWPLTHFMQGQFRRIEGDVRAAIQAFELAYSKSLLRVRQKAREQLADLYKQDEQYGLALSTVESVIEAYVGSNQEVPVRWYLNKVDLLQRLNKPQQALHLVEDQLRRHPDHVILLQLRVPSLRALGRTDEAQRALERAEKAQIARDGDAGGNTAVALNTASLAASLGDYAGAENKLRAILDKDPENMAAVILLVRVLTADERREVAKQTVAELRGKVSDPAIRRYLAGYEVVLGTTDAKERDAGLLELIEQTPDAFERYGELYNFHVAEERRDLDKAEHYLAEMIKLRPDSTALIDKQFGVALMRKDFSAAERHAVRLAAANADHCQGAMYRGRLELARDNPDKAVGELRSAERLLPSNSFLKTLIAQAVVRSSSGSLDEAVEVLKNAIEINPLNFQAHALMFRLYIQLGDRDSAIEHLMTASKLDPNDPFIKSNKQLVDEEDDPQAGIVRREELRAAQPDDVANLLRLAELYWKTGDSVRAEEHFALVLEKEPDNWTAVQMIAGFFG